MAIVLNLQCGVGHAFEGWFGSSEDCDAQQARGLLSCPLCANAEIKRMPSAPRINLGAGAKPTEVAEPTPAEIRAQVQQFVRQLRANSEDVGQRFAEEARRIHGGEAEERAIRGQASPEETRELIEDGIPVLPLPAAADDPLH
ncbi:DUF1178 family protein [Burkholderiaceae bacterium UC74_6]